MYEYLSTLFAINYTIIFNLLRINSLHDTKKTVNTYSVTSFTRKLLEHNAQKCQLAIALRYKNRQLFCETAVCEYMHKSVYMCVLEINHSLSGSFRIFV